MTRNISVEMSLKSPPKCAAPAALTDVKSDGKHRVNHVPRVGSLCNARTLHILCKGSGIEHN